MISVETQEIAGTQRKVIEFSSQPNGPEVEETWIEGVGSLSGLDNFGRNFDNNVELRCFEINGEIYFFNGAEVCFKDLGYEENYKGQITLSPNPVATQAILSVPLELNVDQIQIFDFQGRMVLSEPITEAYFNIDANGLTTGMYFYQVSSASKILKTNRFLVE